MPYYMRASYVGTCGSRGEESYVCREHPVSIVAKQNLAVRAGALTHRLSLLFFEKIPDEVYAEIVEAGDLCGIEEWTG